MKKILLLLVSVLTTLQAYAYDFEVDGIYYKITSAEDMTVGVDQDGSYSGCYSGDVVLPASVTCDGETFSVTSIGANAFWSSKELTSVTIAESITKIGTYAFYYCSKLTSITIPNSVKSIGNYAFAYTGLTSITIPEGVNDLGHKIFDHSKLTSLVVSADNKKFDSRGNCNAIIETATNTLIIGINGSTIPAGVTHIGEYAFAGCAEITDLTLPKGVISIGEYAFSNCYGLSSVTLPEGLTSIGEYAFNNCYGLSSVTLPESLTSIGVSAFSFCGNLSSITFPDSLTSIGDGAFDNCCSLDSIVIPAGLTDIGSAAFINCELSSLVVAEGNPVYDSRDSCNAIIETATNTLIIGINGSTIPAGVTHIDDYAFYECDFDSIQIPEGVTSIGEYAFCVCTSLTAIQIPESVTSIGKEAFSYCTNLPIIDGIRYADTYLVEAVDQDLSTYNIKEGTRFIGDYAFDYFSNVDSIILPDGVISIGENAFECSSISYINIPESVTSIGEYAFCECNNLPVIDGLRYADTYLLGPEDPDLTTYTIKEGTRFIGDGAFVTCSLDSIRIPESVISIGMCAFYGCYNLAAITIPEGVTHIGEEAFIYCSSLESVTNLSQVPQPIDENCFSGYGTLYVPAGCKSAYEAAEVWKCFTIEELDSPTGIEQLQSAASAPGKVMMGNKLMIQKMGRQYDLTGRKTL